jgi:stage II sporulation protein D
MTRSEPVLAVGILDGVPNVSGAFHGQFRTETGETLSGSFTASAGPDGITVADEHGTVRARGAELQFSGPADARFEIRDVTIGIQFHWERKERQIFEGRLRLVARRDGSLTVINDIALERYLASVISSEMSAESSLEFLRAHAITSRSWLVAMLDRRGSSASPKAAGRVETVDRIVRWYDREDHDSFDVCADDHCQRYQGVSKIVSAVAIEAVASTRGIFLVHESEVCDARFYKCCGGRTEEFPNAWEDKPVPYLQSVTDAPTEGPPLADESAARRWIETIPPAYCNTSDPHLLKRILPSFDQETTDFYRWTVDYARRELEEILQRKSGIDFGDLLGLEPVVRGPSGRIVELRIRGSKRSVVVGKELEIRKWLSKSHLYSSAFIVLPTGPLGKAPERFLLRGAGWGHGVGLCQIGAAVMAERGFPAEAIVKHYFRSAELKKLYP